MMKTTQMVDVLLADDHPLMMAGFETVLEGYGIKTIAKTTISTEVIRLYEEKKPDVVVMDIRFGEKMTGLEAAKDILGKYPDANIVFLSQFDQDSLIKETYRLGAQAFLTKGCTPDDLAEAIHLAHQGKKFFLPEVATRLANLAIQGDISPQSKLDEREFIVFKYMARGMTNLEIAEKMNLSPKTISNTSQTIKEKLGVHRPAEITRLAVKHALIEP